MKQGYEQTDTAGSGNTPAAGDGRLSDSAPPTGNGNPSGGQEQRRAWMSLLASAEPSDLESYTDRLPSGLRYSFLRRPETGLLMMQARAGNTGTRFNLGEVVATRCVISLQSPEGDSVEGFAVILGRSGRHAELAAVYDALLQTAAAPELEQGLLPLLSGKKREAEERKNTATERTKVDFFTMVRGED